MLLKKKGTAEGLRMLVNVYGIPDTIIRINEFGGKSYENQAYDNFVDQFNYAFYSEGNGYVSTNLQNSGNGLSPTTIQFRFKTNGIPPTSPYSELLWWTLPGISTRKYITLTYSGTGYTSGSYSGSIPDPNNEYATLEFYQEATGGSSCTLNLPFYNDEWWSVMLTLGGGNATLYAANNIYEGYDGSNIGFIASSSTTSPNFTIPATQYLSNSTFRTVNGKTCYPFSGSFQEWRVYYNETLNANAFKDYVMNPYSIEGNSQTGSNSTPNSLYFRAPLGTMLDNNIIQTSRTSIHPAISFIPPTQSFQTAGNSTYTLNSTFSFEPNTEVLYQNQFVAGVQNSVSEKIRIVDMVLPSGNTLSPYISIQQTLATSENFTKDVNYVEAAFSPQDEVNDDIISQLGYFNIGSYIGDPRYLVSGSLNYYPDFDKLRDYYFSKYTHSYDLNDYVRLIKFFDNSLFKMIKDFTPARAGLASGIVIKPTLLERCRYPQPKVNTQSTITFVGSPTTRTLNIAY
jgi:hypothetical protein